MSPISRHHEWAKRGAAIRLQELDQERKEILQEYPDLGKAFKTRTMSAEARKRMSEGMRKHWLKRRAAQKAAKAPKVTK